MLDDLREVWWLVAVAIAAAAWLTFAEHPTARNFRRAVQDTLDL
jgi:hypothetical protein